MKTLLKEKNFLLFLFGRNTSVFGDVMLTTALALYVLHITKSPKMFGSILALAYIPRLVLSTFSGALVDGMSKKAVMVSLDFIRGFLLLYLVFSGELSMASVYIIILSFSVSDTFFHPASVAVIPRIIPRDNMVQANSIDETVGNAVTIISPIIASLLYASGGIQIVLILDGITFILSALSEIFMFFDDSVSKEKKKLAGEMFKGYMLLKKDRKLGSLVLNGALTHFFLMPFIEVGITTLLLIVFRAPELHYGIVRGVMSASAVIAGIITMLVRNKSISRNINIGIIGMIAGAAFFLLMIYPPFTTALQSHSLLPLIYLSACSFLIILAFGYYAVFFRSYYQSEVPSALLGRFTSLFMICVSLSRISGMYLFGILFEDFPIAWPLTVLALGMILKLLVHIPFLKIEREERYAENPAL